MAEVVCSDIPGPGLFRETQDWLVVSIGQAWRLRRWELKAIGCPANSVEKAVHLLIREPKRGGVAFQNFLVLEEQVIAEHEPPFASTKPLEDLE